MRTRATPIIGAVALAICLLCPLVDIFDQWDHALQTGTDSEYLLVVLALCVGLAFNLGRLVVRLGSDMALPGVRFCLQGALNLSPLLNASVALTTPPGSPPLRLRI